MFESAQPTHVVSGGYDSLETSYTGPDACAGVSLLTDVICVYPGGTSALVNFYVFERCVFGSSLVVWHKLDL